MRGNHYLTKTKYHHCHYNHQRPLMESRVLGINLYVSSLKMHLLQVTPWAHEVLETQTHVRALSSKSSQWNTQDLQSESSKNSHAEVQTSSQQDWMGGTRKGRRSKVAKTIKGKQKDESWRFKEDELRG